MAGSFRPASPSIRTAGRSPGRPPRSGTKSFTVTATDSSSPKALTATVNLSISVVAALAVTTTSLPTAQTGTVYPGATLGVERQLPVTWAVSSGAVPAGLALDPTTGAICTPSGPGAVSTFTVTATDSTGPAALTATANLSISVASQPLAVTTTSLPSGQVNVVYPGQP